MAEIKPQHGPQLAFLMNPADIAIYGGAAGGGKSYGLLLEPLRHIYNAQFGGVIFRRTLADVKKEGSLWDTSMPLYGACYARPRQDNLSWKFPSNAKITFAGLDHETSVLDWQGSQLCCEEHERVRMADGSLKAIRDIHVSDTVCTLQGPRRVQLVGDRRLEYCVLATARSCGGGLIGQQVHSLTHKVLTAGGWVSYASLAASAGVAAGPLSCAASSRPTSSCPLGSSLASRLYRSVRIFFDKCDRICRFLLQLPGSPFYRSALPQGLLQWREGRQSWLARAAYKAPRDLGSGCAESAYEREEVRRPALTIRNVVFHAQPVRPVGPCRPFVYLRGVSSYVRNACRRINSLGRYWFSPRQYGGHVASQDSIRGASPQLAGVVGRNQTGSPSDDQGIAQRDNSRKVRYDHPYTGSLRTAEAETVLGSCELIPCGGKWVIDLTIESENHYITEHGFVNRNCFIGFDELTHFSRTQFFYMLSRNRSTCGIRPYVRCTTNPDADSWVAELIAWWIDQDTGSAIPERSGVIRWFARINDEIRWADSSNELTSAHTECEPKSLTFIPARLEDNRILMAADPGYRANLMALPHVERERLLGGNWKVRPSAGLYFQRHWCKFIDIMPAETRFVRGWDLAATAKTEGNDPDWTAATKIGRMTNGRFVVAHHLRLRGTPMEVERSLLNLASSDGPMTRIAIPEDPGQAGKSQAQQLVRMLAGYDVRTKRVTGDKATRFGAFSAQAEAGNVDILRGAWNESWCTALEAFPESAHDDDVDSTSEAFNLLTGEQVISFHEPIVNSVLRQFPG